MYGRDFLHLYTHKKLWLFKSFWENRNGHCDPEDIGRKQMYWVSQRWNERIGYYAFLCTTGTGLGIREHTWAEIRVVEFVLFNCLTC